jgi:hypothetical protein
MLRPSPAHLQSELAKGNDKRVKLIQKYRTVVEKELDNICGEILGLLDRCLSTPLLLQSHSLATSTLHRCNQITMLACCALLTVLVCSLAVPGPVVPDVEFRRGARARPSCRH